MKENTYHDVTAGLVAAAKLSRMRYAAVRRLLLMCKRAGLPAPHLPCGGAVRLRWPGVGVTAVGPGLFDLGDRHGFAARGVTAEQALEWLKAKSHQEGKADG